MRQIILEQLETLKKNVGKLIMFIKELEMANGSETFPYGFGFFGS